MNIVWGVANLLRKAPPPAAPGDEPTPLPRLPAPSPPATLTTPPPGIVFSDVTEEGVLNTLWKKYENALDKVEKEESLQIFVLQFVQTFRDWGPHPIEQLVDQELGYDETVLGCACGHPSEVTLILIQEISLITSIITEIRFRPKGQIVLRSMHSLDIVWRYDGAGKTITSLAVTPEECFLAGTKDGSLLVFSIETPLLRRGSMPRKEHATK